MHCNLTGIIAFCLQSMDFILMDVVSPAKEKQGPSPRMDLPRKTDTLANNERTS